MRLSSLLHVAFYLTAVLASSLPVQEKRALNDVFDPFQTRGTAEETHIEHGSEHLSTTTHSNPASTVSLAELLTSSEPSTKTKDATTSSHTQTTSNLPTTSNAIINTPSPTPTYNFKPAEITSSSPIVPSSTHSASGGQPISRGTEEWKIIGVAVIAFSAVAAVLLLSVFFDQWWGFLRDLVWKKKRKDAFEEFIPDWEKAGWELRMDTDRHRYPSMPSPAKTRSPGYDVDADVEKRPSAEYMTGIGTGFANSNNLYTLQPAHNNWPNGLGILTPAPQARISDQSPVRSASLSRSRSQRQATSPALTDPYGGIEGQASDNHYGFV
jgi:hypothetical protein